MVQSLLKQSWISRVVHANGIGIHLVEAGPSDGRPVFLLHGFPEFWWSWRNLIEPLAAAGMRVLAPDLRGYNLTDAPSGVDAYALDVLANDVVELANILGIGRFALVGHDWGGVIAWRTTARFAERVGKLAVMNAPHPDIWARQAIRHPSQAVRSSYALFFQLPIAPELTLRAFDHAAARALLVSSSRPGTFSQAELNHYMASWSRPRRLTAMLNYYRAFARRDAVASPARIAPETLIVWGENDVALERHLATASLELCDNGALESLGATHWLHHEEPNRVSSILADFLSR